MQLVCLENASPTPLTLVLPHDTACSEAGCVCVRQQVVKYDHNPKTGDVAGRAGTQRTPSSITLFGAGRPGSSSKTLPVSVLRAPDVVRASRAGKLKVRRIDQVVKAEPTPDPTPMSEPTPSSEPTDAAGTVIAQLENYPTVASDDIAPAASTDVSRRKKER